MSDLRTWRTVFIIVLIFLSPEMPRAAGFNVSPVRVVLSSKASNAAITLHNTGDRSLVVQTELMKWQPAGAYQPSRDILVNPAIFTLAPDASQILRIGLSAPVDPREELSYRLFLREVPPPMRKGMSGLRTALKVGIPVFIPPSQPNLEVRWSASRTKKGALRIEALNRGNVHIQLITLSVAFDAKAGDTVSINRSIRDYLLPGESGQWVVKPDAGWNEKSLSLTAVTDGGRLNAKLLVARP